MSACQYRVAAVPSGEKDCRKPAYWCQNGRYLCAAHVAPSRPHPLAFVPPVDMPEPDFGSAFRCGATPPERVA